MHTPNGAVTVPRLRRPSALPAMLERVDWASGLAFSSFGARVGIRASEPGVLDSLAERLPPRARPAASPVVDELYSMIVGEAGEAGRRGLHRVYAGDTPIARTPDLAEALAALASDLHFAVALQARGYLFVHAGVVGWRDRAILIPGRSRSGKSRLVQALVAAGAEYYSDEFAVLDAGGAVLPYPRALHLRDETGRQCPVAVEELGGRAGRRPLRAGLVLIAPYQQRAQWHPRRLTPGEGLLALLGNTVVARARPEQALERLRPVAVEAVCLRGRRGEADELAPAILEQLESVRWAA